MKIDYLIEFCRIDYKTVTGGFLLPLKPFCEKVTQSNRDHFDLEKEAAKRGADLISDLKSRKYMNRVITNVCSAPDTNRYPPRWVTKCMDKDGGYDYYFSIAAGKIWRKENK